MALYRINQRNTLFRGFVGEFVNAAPDALMNAAVMSGVLSRMDAPVVESVPEVVEVVEAETSVQEPVTDDASQKKRRK